jgi:4-diphosphocytidyl-2-C-methyl-D-erythritol kinase
MTGITVRAHAKINLFLKVVGRRPDGYHDLFSIFQTVGLHDLLTLEPLPEGIDLDCDDPGVPAGPGNLAWRAAGSLPPPGSGPRGVRIRIAKRIPSGAGLGGGSSDAAAALVGVARLWGLDPGTEDLAGRAAGIGSDVPFFLTGGTALATGRGTTIMPLPDLVGYHLAIAWPGVPVATAEVYSRLDAPLTSSHGISRIRRLDSATTRALRDGVAACVRLGNDLEIPACAICPAIGEIKERLMRLGAAAAAMTGSGSAVFGVFETPAEAARAADALNGGGFRAVASAPLGRPEYRRSLGIV